LLGFFDFGLAAAMVEAVVPIALAIPGRVPVVRLAQIVGFEL